MNSNNFFDYFNLLSKKDILADFTESRDCCARGEYQDIDEALDEISKLYGLDDMEQEKEQ